MSTTHLPVTARLSFADTPAAAHAPPAGAQAITLSGGTIDPSGGGGDTLWLLPQRAVWWPAAQTVFVADVHFGKAATFRRAGQPVPHGTTADNLARLDAVLDVTQANHLIFLGDFLHARSGAADALWQQLRPWRERHSAVRMTLVAGNHDQHAGAPPAWLDIAPASEPWQPVSGAALRACHHPQTVAGALVLAGHWHPTVTLRGPARDVMRLPCFVQTTGRLVLPAFGAFTGMSSASLPPAAQRYAVVGDRVQAVVRRSRRG